jgi:hypothetical protein
MRSLAVMFALFMSFCFAGEGVYSAPDAEPTPEETLILEFMNRFRADPSADADRIAPGGVTIQGFLGNGVDWDMFKSEMKMLKPAPPLVFNLQLLDAARKHSHYMILNGLTHDEDPAKPGFVAANFGERMRKAGYSGGGGGENCFRDAMNPWHSHAGFVVDFGPGGTGGMQPGRGHRTNMINAGYREVGCSALPHGSGRFSVTHNFGSRRGNRLAGGVIYFDRNGNNFYDIGEGIGGVKISVEGASTATWKSGAYTLELKNDQAVTLTAEYAGQTFSKKFEPGKENLKFDWIVPEKIALEKADQLLSTFDKLTDPKTPAYFKAQVALAMGTRGLNVDAGRQNRIAELTGSVGAELDRNQQTVKDALKNIDLQTWSKTLSESRKLYGGTLAETWFREAEMVANLKVRVAGFEKAASQIPIQEKKQFATQLDSLEKQLTDISFKAEVSALATKLRNSAAPPQLSRR